MVETVGLKEVAEAVKFGRRAEAESAIAHLVESQPELTAKEWFMIARHALAIGEAGLATKAAEQFDRVAVKNLDSQIQRAGIHAEAGDIKKAQKILEPLLKKGVKNPSLYHFLGTIKAQQGNIEDAVGNLSTAVKDAPHLGVTWLTLAKITDFSKNSDLFDALINAEGSVKQDDARNRSQYLYARAKAYEDRGDYDAAWCDYETGAALMKPSMKYDPDLDNATVETLKRHLARTQGLTLPKGRTDYRRPIALLGVPRSGTTLLGQMLAAHSKVNGSGEFNAMGAACMHMQRKDIVDFPSFIARHGHPEGAIDHIAKVYESLVEQRFSGKHYVVDKSLNLNRFFGIWALAFPHAKAIYIKRDDADTALSCLTTHFRGQYGWSWSVDDIKQHIACERELFAHWQEAFPSRILEIEYEDLVSSPSDTLAKICDFLDIEYEVGMLAFHKTKSPVFTSSVGQVHQPIHQNRLKISEKFKSFQTLWND